MRGHRSTRLPRVVASGLAALATAITAHPRDARALDFEVQSDTAAQAYQVASPWGDTILDRRRLMQTLSLGVYNLQGDHVPGRADFAVVLRVRLDADFGINGHLGDADRGGETSYLTEAGPGVRFVPGLQQAPVDLMYAYVEGRNLLNGWLGFRAGRQYVVDSLGWWSFDGALARVTTPYFVQAELYGGLEQRGGLPLSTSRYERPGVWRGNHAGFGTAGDQPSVTDFPSYQYTQPAPAFGVSLESNGPSWIHGRLSYRRVYNTGTSVTQQFPDPTGGYRTAKGLRVSQDRLGYALDLNKSDLGAIKGGVTYDFYNQIVGSYYGGVEAYLGKRATVGADIDYFVPTFDADSIFNWFTKSPITTATARVWVAPTQRLDLSAYGGVRIWMADGDPETFGTEQCRASGLCSGDQEIDPSNSKTFTRDPDNREISTTIDALANVSGRYRFGTGEVGLRGMMQAGARGHTGGADLSGEKRFDGGRYRVGGRVSVYDWNDPLRPDRGATSFGYVLGAGVRPVQQADLRIEWEHDMNRLVGQRFRIVALLNLRLGG
ncbi:MULTISPECIES: hypothetical protein [Polyangium]|uniref:Capsule assembly Wzi family protein n=1 Tax=Polyangium sorediatum TaxID=889274 RepID=A0ABT6NQR7_9BACT|nr:MULTISPECIES: hypothetical protein [Polyangium]MDI1430505.1 hypothetical protein [Polyangium sorediatum]